MPEFELIRHLQEIISTPGHAHGPGCVVGIGDDAAVLEVPEDRHLVVCTDTLVEGVHFLPETPPGAIGHKSLAVNLSDLAAMGAEPAWFFMALTLPDSRQQWLEQFAHGMAELAHKTKITLAGGDVTSGGLSICITAVGLLEKGRALTRAGAIKGDLVAVSGRPGRAANALKILQSGGQPAAEDRLALDKPEPRLHLGQALQGLATSCIDISDGLLADLGHILEQSGVGARLELEKLPCPESLRSMDDEDRWPLQLAGGDDYELCFTLPPAERGQLDDIAQRCGVEITLIGVVTEQHGLVLTDRQGERYNPGLTGYVHFQTEGERGQ